ALLGCCSGFLLWRLDGQSASRKMTAVARQPYPDRSGSQKQTGQGESSVLRGPLSSPASCRYSSEGGRRRPDRTRGKPDLPSPCRGCAMRDEDKTREQLLEELRALRTRVAREERGPCHGEEDPRKPAEAALEQYASRLQALSRRVVQVQEEQRRHLARELHDGICQILTSVAFAFEAGASAPAEMTAARMAEARALHEEALTRVRELSFDLRPALLDHLGLLPALRCRIGRDTAPTGSRC